MCLKLGEKDPEYITQEENVYLKWKEI